MGDSMNTAEEGLDILISLADFLRSAEFVHAEQTRESNSCLECGAIAYRCAVPMHKDGCAVARALAFLDIQPKGDTPC